MEESGTRKVEMPADDNARAMSWPSYLIMAMIMDVAGMENKEGAYDGPVSATITV
jgi:hypothetical protein